MLTAARFALALPLALIACGGTVTPASGGGDGGAHDDGAVADATPDRAISDGGCVTAVQGSACTSSELACMPPGDACCIGYVWACVSGAWMKEGLGCPCAIDASLDISIDTTPDVAKDVAAVDANPAACPADWTAASTGDHAALCGPPPVACVYPEGSCECHPFCGGIAPPDGGLPPSWTCTPKRTDGCAEAAPNDGDACGVSGQACTYGPCCMTTYTCTGGYWKAGPMACPG